MSYDKFNDYFSGGNMKNQICIYIIFFTCFACQTTQVIQEKNFSISVQKNNKKIIKPSKALSFAQQFSPSFYTQTYQTLQLQNKTYQKVRKIFDLCHCCAKQSLIFLAG